MTRTSGILLGTLVLSAAAFAGPVLVTTPGALGANDTVDWLQLGADQTPLGATFNATSANSVAVTGAFGSGALDQVVSVVCPELVCSWQTSGTGMNAGDSVVWTVDSGPLTLGFSASFGAGLWLQTEFVNSYQAQIEAFNGATSLGAFTENGNSNGDPVFIGVLDPTQEITSIELSLNGDCGFGCSDTDFAVDTLNLVDPVVTATPEPGTLWLLAAVLPLFIWRGVGKFRLSTVKAAVPAILLAGVAIATVPAVFAQDLTLPANAPVLSDSQATAALRANSAITAAKGFTTVAGPLPIGLYSVVGYDGNLYQGELVGRSPFLRGAKTTSVQVVVIPLIVKTPSTASGNFISDPTAADDGCLGAGNTAVSLTQGSPILNQPPAPWVFNGVNVGGLTYTDAHMRGEFWQLVSPTGNSFHLALPYIVAATQTIDATGQALSNANTLGYGGTHCGANAGRTNFAGALGFLNINYLDPILNTMIANLGLTHNQFPFFVIYRTVISGGSTLNTNNCCILGYHSNDNNATSIQDPGQTYGIALYDTGDDFSDVSDSSVMAHEMSEWANDPAGNNPTPVYSSGQTRSCAAGGQNNFETGDALSGISNNHHIAMPNGKTYTLQELVYFSWFYNADHAGSLGAGVCAGLGSGCFSTNGTFKGPAQPCPTGGTYPD